jgi:hypothetical protein
MMRGSSATNRSSSWISKEWSITQKDTNKKGADVFSGSLEIDNLSRTHKVRARQMISAPSIHSLYQASAACGALRGMVWNLTVIARPWLAEDRKTAPCGRMKIVTG